MKTILKVVLWVLIVLLVLFVSFIIIFPKFISTQKGKEITLDWLNHHIDGKISVEKIDLNWFSGQHIEKFYLADSEGKEIVSFDTFSTGEALFSALIGRYNVGQTILQTPHLYVDENPDGELNVAKVLKVNKKKESEKEIKWHLPKFKGSISIIDGEMTLTSSKVTVPVTLSDIRLEAKDSFSRFHLQGKTSQGSNEGDVLIYGQCCENIQVLALVNNFPVSLIDQLNESKIYEAALGNVLNLNLELAKKDHDLALEAKINTPNLEGNFKGLSKNETFSLEKGNILFTVTPNFFKAFFDSKEWHLANRPELVIDIEKLILPLQLKTPDFRLIPFLGKMTLERAEMTHTELGILSLNDFKADFATQPNPEKNFIDVQYSALIQGKGDPTELGGNVQVYGDQSVEFCTSFKSLPTDVLELVMSADLPYLHKILGEQFTLDLLGKYNKGLNVDLKLVTSKFDIQGNVKGPNTKELHTNLDGVLFIPPRYKPYLGNESPNIHIDADLSFYERTLAIPSLKIEANNSHFALDISGKVGEKNKYFDYKDVNITGIGRIMHLPLTQGGLDYHGRFLFKFDGEKNNIMADAILTSLSETEESLVFNFDGKNVVVNNALDFRSGELDLLAKVRDFPVIFFDNFFDRTVKLYPLIGSALDVEAHLHKLAGKEEVISGDIEMESQGFFLQLALLMNGGLQINPSKPALVHWEMTPERYQYLVQFAGAEKRAEYILAQDVAFDLIVEKFSCPKLPVTHLEAFICDGGLTGKITAESIVFKDPNTSETLTIKNIAAQIIANDVSKSIAFDFNSDIESRYVPVDGNSGIGFKLVTVNLLTPEGKFNKENFTVNGEVSLEFIPVGQMTAILPLKGQTKQTLNALLGSLLNARIYGQISQLSGPLTIDIKASNLKGILPLQFTTESLTLQKNVEVELTLTEEVNAVLLKDVTPILISGAWSDHPLKLFIAAEGFYAPLRPFLFKDIQVQKAVLDLGKVRVKNGGEILSLMKFLKAKEVSSEGVMEAWFTPIFINLRNGVASYKRFDALLAGNVHIAMWGGIDIVNDRVNMTLGISPSTLQSKYDFKGMSSKDMFQVKMGGSTSKLDLDWSSAYTRIGIILTKASAGHIGYIVGGILEGLLGLVGEETTPDPTTSPFPWEKPKRGFVPQEGMPQEVSWEEEPTAGLRKILSFIIPR